MRLTAKYFQTTQLCRRFQRCEFGSSSSKTASITLVVPSPFTDFTFRPIGSYRCKALSSICQCAAAAASASTSAISAGAAGGGCNRCAIEPDHRSTVTSYSASCISCFVLDRLSTNRRRSAGARALSGPVNGVVD